MIWLMEGKGKQRVQRILESGVAVARTRDPELDVAVPVEQEDEGSWRFNGRLLLSNTAGISTETSGSCIFLKLH